MHSSPAIVIFNSVNLSNFIQQQIYFLDTLRAVMVEIYACWTYHVRDLTGKCYDLNPTSLCCSSLTTALSSAFFVKERPSWTDFLLQFKNSWRSWNSNTRIFMMKPSFTRFIWFIFHMSINRRNLLFKCIFHHFNSVL
jgi:hypothetical protein